MGYTTTVVINNDCLSDIAKDPGRFVEDIMFHMSTGDEHAFGHTIVFRTDHSSVPRLYWTHQNSGYGLTEYDGATVRLYERRPDLRPHLRATIENARTLLNGLERALDRVDTESPAV